MSAKRARELEVSAPVPILGFGQGHTSWDVPLRPDVTETMAGSSAETAFRMAGLGPKRHRCRPDLRLLHDHGADDARGLRADPGRARRGEFASEGAFSVGGGLPLNTSGGLLAETGMPGMQLVHRRRAADARHVGQPGARRPHLHRQQPRWDHAHPLDADPRAVRAIAWPTRITIPQPPTGRRSTTGGCASSAAGPARTTGCRRATECPRCWSSEWAWEDARGEGRVVSWVVYHTAFHEAFKAPAALQRRGRRARRGPASRHQPRSSRSTLRGT